MYILAGPNGSGKTSALKGEIPEDVTFLNADKFSREIAKERGIPEDRIQNAVDTDVRLQLAGGRKVIEEMRKHIKQGDTFAVETTLDTVLYQNTYIKNAKSNGFEVELLYVGTESPQINIERVEDRVAKGGHDIKPEVIVGRYYGSLECLNAHIEMVDKAKIYDNSLFGGNARRILSFAHGKIVEKSEHIPEWVNKYINHEKHLHKKERSLDPKQWAEEVKALNLLPDAKIYATPNEQIAYKGEVLYKDADNRFFALKSGERTITLHDARKFPEGLPGKGATVRINYRNGVARVSPVKESNHERGSQVR